MYAASSKPNEVHVYQAPCEGTRGAWIRVRTIRLPIRKSGYTVTLSVGKQLRCCSWREKYLHEHLLQSNDWKTYACYGSKDAKRSCEPFICDDDVRGNVLVADRGNHRLTVVVDQTGECRFVVLGVTMPICATVFKDNLYVINSKFIYKFVSA